MDQFNALPNVIDERKKVGKVKVGRSQRTHGFSREKNLKLSHYTNDVDNNTHNTIKLNVKKRKG